MRRAFFSFVFFKLWGWKIKGKLPETPKYVIVVAPHTSNIDFFIGVCVKYILHNFKPRYLGKKSLFTIPLVGWFLKSIGGYPVDRSQNRNLVEQIVDIFNDNDEFIMTITPEGTRSYVEKWKTGFYYVAVKAKVPIMMAGFDYEHKIVELKEAFYPSGNVEEDIEKMQAYFRTIKGKYPEKGVR